jgi:hypothetical protein
MAIQYKNTIINWDPGCRPESFLFVRALQRVPPGGVYCLNAFTSSCLQGILLFLCSLAKFGGSFTSGNAFSRSVLK